MYRASQRLLAASFLNINGLPQITRYLKKASYVKGNPLLPKKQKQIRGIGEEQYREYEENVLIIINFLRNTEKIFHP